MIVENIVIDGINLEYCFIAPKNNLNNICLAIHGNGGGYNQGLNMVKPNLPDDWGILSISRFGYLNSEIPKDPSPTNQAKFIKCLIDHLNIEEIVLFYTSAGSFTGIRFALMYPSIVKRIISLSGVAFSPNMLCQKTPPTIILNDFFFSIFKNLFPSFFRSMFGISKNEWMEADYNSKFSYNKIINDMFPVAPRRKGMINDNKNTVNDGYKNYKNYIVEDIKCPILLIHSDTDPWNSGNQIKEMSKRIEKCVLKLFDSGGHVLLGYESQIKETIHSFVNNTNL